MDIFYIFTDDFFPKEKKKQKEYKGGRYIVEYVAKNIYGIKNSELEILEGKPKFKYSDVQFSISHSKDIAAVCFDDFPVGFDIEYIKPRNYVQIAQRMNFQSEQNTLEEFYKCWTRYEAEYKLGRKSIKTITSTFLGEYIYSVSTSNKKEFKPEIKRLIKI